MKRIPMQRRCDSSIPRPLNLGLVAGEFAPHSYLQILPEVENGTAGLSRLPVSTGGGGDQHCRPVPPSGEHRQITPAGVSLPQGGRKRQPTASQSHHVINTAACLVDRHHNAWPDTSCSPPKRRPLLLGQCRYCPVH
ncbi:unnamed protein product [Merluccius merluccius]